MKVFVFTGPTLSEEDVRRELDATCLPPAAQGDVYRVSLERPGAIGIIDGYFERVPSVWHKEILWALSQGIHIFGSASMGALRAAELAPFGMEGVGTIYEAFRSGELRDDDEVAVTHGAAEDGYRVLTEAMVNIRGTLRRAEEEGVLRPATRAGLERMAKSLFYAERAWPTLLAGARREGLPEDEVAALRAWLPRGRVDQKREDALAMLRVIRERLAEEPGPKQVRFTFEHTDAWEEMRHRAARLPLGGRGDGPGMEEALLEELRLSGNYARAARGALGRALALEEARRQGRRSDEASLGRAELDLRREHGVLTPEGLTRWLEENGVEDFQRLLRDEADVRWVHDVLGLELERCLPDHLRVSGEYAALVARARDKLRVLGAHEPEGAEPGMTEEALWRWYFVTHLGRPVPDDLEHYARTAGFGEVRSLRRAVRRELLYARRRMEEGPESSGGA
ncbi:TfuA-like protein [Archangium lipolyticum]|uniref:TfuA-like protein n=1 Tax=Archangium lipolyticum TaxID=2970465 RepID=UPI002DD68576|nr:TfuA-like protein [Archangium lipolyticum]